MNRMLRSIFGALVKTTREAGGRRFTSGHYMALSADGRTWKVERHTWSIPVSSKGWRAECEGKTVYADTLVELANKLGYSWDLLEPE